MSYTTDDFRESIACMCRDRGDAAPAMANIQRVIAGWGHGNGMGKDTGPGWSTSSATEWSGGFLVALKDGRYAYISGWCDYTGWGCQDGGDVAYFDDEPTPASLAPDAQWDLAPVDLNRWIDNGCPDDWPTRSTGGA